MCLCKMPGVKEDRKRKENDISEHFSIRLGGPRDLRCLPGKPSHCMEVEREKGGPFFVFAEMSLLSRHFACYLESSQSKMLSPSQREHPDAGSSCSGAQEPSTSSLGD